VYGADISAQNQFGHRIAQRDGVDAHPTGDERLSGTAEREFG
jgi:hypothetical protein